MLAGYIAGCALYGFTKATVLGARRGHTSSSTFMHSLGGPELMEELQYRVGVEQGLKHLGGVGEVPARVTQSILFGLIHPGNEVEAALGGYIYSKAYAAHGLMGSLLAHCAHNLGCWLGAK